MGLIDGTNFKKINAIEGFALNGVDLYFTDGNVLYVTPTVSNSNPERLDAINGKIPYTTIQDAVEASEANDTIVIRQGTYTENISYTNDNQSNNIILEKGVVINGNIVRTNSTNPHVLSISSKSNILPVINGFIQLPSSGSGSSLYLENIKIVSSSSGGAIFQTVGATCEIKNCEISSDYTGDSNTLLGNISKVSNSWFKSTNNSVGSFETLEAINSKFISESPTANARVLIGGDKLKMSNCLVKGGDIGVAVNGGNNLHEFSINGCDFDNDDSNITAQTTGFTNSFINITGGNFKVDTGTTNITIIDGHISINGANLSHDVTSTGSGSVEGSFNKDAALKILDI